MGKYVKFINACATIFQIAPYKKMIDVSGLLQNY